MGQDRPIVVAVGGGVDSALVLNWAKSQGFAPIYAVTVDFGDRIEDAKKLVDVATFVKEHKIIKVSGMDGDVSGASGEIEKRFALGNLLVLAAAANFAVSVDAKDIAIGIVADESEVPEQREQHRNKAEDVINDALYGHYEGFTVHAPFSYVTRDDAKRLYERLPAETPPEPAQTSEKVSTPLSGGVTDAVLADANAVATNAAEGLKKPRKSERQPYQPYQV